MLLKGIRVLDLTTLLPGPMCSLFLADLGAEVVKIEGLHGDFMRSVVFRNTQTYFSALNRNKKSIAIDLKKSKGKEIFMKLAKKADVIIESFRPGKADSLSIGYKNIRKINPKIIYCSISGYGQYAKYKNRAGHDLNYIASSGLLEALSLKPYVPCIQIADTSCAVTAAFSIASSLFYREKSGNGNYIDVPIFSSALSLIGIHIAHYSIAGGAKTLLSSNNTPCYNVYRTKDKRYVSLGAVEQKFWQAFCNALNRKDFLKRQMDSSIMKEMKSIFKSKTSTEWVRLNKKHDFCCEPVSKIKDVVNDKDLNKRKVIIQLDGVKQVAMPMIFSSFKKMNYNRAPKLGENSKEILASIGYSKGSIKEFIDKGIVA
ncbi:CoA transferase [Candidatus Woesearchaeota archaeon]|nr:CoA transferase [Candidatus Woesearchaeota archaeon]